MYTILRVWVQGVNNAHIICEKLASFKPEYLAYNNTQSKYSIYSGRVIFNMKWIAFDYDNIIATVSPNAQLIERLNEKTDQWENVPLTTILG